MLNPVQAQSTEDPYRWKILILATFTNMFVVAAPTMALPVLFDMVAADLNLSLVQVGVIWGIGALPAMVSSLVGGALADRFGPKRMLIAACLAGGLFSGLRGATTDFLTLAAAMVMVGLVVSMVPLNGMKLCSQWFPSRQFGLASGLLSMGMAAGFLLGSMLSASVLAPLLGGWRPVLFLFGAIACALALPWFFIRAKPATTAAIGLSAPPAPSFRQDFRMLLSLPSIWLMGIGLLGISGCMQGTLGYLPLYLRGQGWQPASADSALAAFHSISMVFVIPIALLSDRIGSRKVVMLAAGSMIVTGVGLMGLTSGALVWFAVLFAGIVRDGFMAVFLAAIIELKQVGSRYAGTATGVVMIFAQIGNLFAPPLGNSLAERQPGLPFLFWAALALVGVISLSFLNRQRKTA